MNGSKPARTFNYRTGQLTEASALSTRSGESATATIQLPKDQKHLQVARAGKFIIATGLYAQGRYLLYTPETGEADYQGSYPEHPVYPDIQESTKSILYASTVLKVSPDQQSFVCADKGGILSHESVRIHGHYRVGRAGIRNLFRTNQPGSQKCGAAM